MSEDKYDALQMVEIIWPRSNAKAGVYNIKRRTAIDQYSSLLY